MITITQVRRHWRKGLLALGLAALAVQSVRLELARHRIRELGFDKLNLQAANDSTRAIGKKAQLALMAMYGQAWQGVQKLVVQEKQEKNKLTKALGVVQVFNGELQIKVKDLELRNVTGSQVTEDTTTRIRFGSFTKDTGRYHVSGRVQLPPPPANLILERLGITQDALSMNAILGCLPRNEDGLRPASLMLAASDSTVELRLGRLSQSREVCNPPRYRGLSIRVPMWFTIVTDLASFIGGYLAPHP